MWCEIMFHLTTSKGYEIRVPTQPPKNTNKCFVAKKGIGSIRINFSRGF